MSKKFTVITRPFLFSLKIVIENARADHRLALKAATKRGEALPAFVAEDVDISHVIPDGSFIIGFSFASSSDMAQVKARKITKVLNIDARNHQHGGHMYIVTGFDSGRHLVPLLHKWSAKNESTETWSNVGNEILAIYGESVNNSEMGAISDRDKGLASGFFGALTEINDVVCYNHLLRDVGTYCGPESMKAFSKMVFATNRDRFLRAKNKANPKLIKYLSSMPEATYAKSFHKICMEGRVASSVTLPLLKKIRIRT